MRLLSVIAARAAYALCIGAIIARPLAAQAGPAANTQHAGNKFDPYHAPGNDAKIFPESEFELWDAATGRLATISVQQVANRE